MAGRPRIEPWLRPVVRRGDEVQFGLLEGGPVVAGVTAAEAGLLARLDGTLSWPEIYALAAEAGLSSRRWRRLLALCTSLGVLCERRATDAGPDLAPAGTGHVVIDGVGPLVADLARLVGEGASGSPLVTTGRAAVDELLATPPSVRPVDLVVLVAGEALDPRRGDVWLARRTRVLPVVAAGPWAAVGPLVGTNPVGPCLWCLDLHRTDRDEDWPALLAQLCPAQAPVIGDAGPVAAPEPALARLVTGTAALLVEQVVAGEEPPLGVSVEVSRPWPRMDHRRWRRHPRCRRHSAEAATGRERAG